MKIQLPNSVSLVGKSSPEGRIVAREVLRTRSRRAALRMATALPCG